MELYQWIMIIFGVLSILGGCVVFGANVLRYLWRIEMAIELIIEQNKKNLEDNKVRDLRIRNLEKQVISNEITYNEEGLSPFAKKKYNT